MVVPLAVAGIVAYLLDPVVVWFQKRGLSRMRAVISTFGLFTLLAAGLISIMIPLVGSQLAEFRRQKEIQVEDGKKRSADEAVIDILIKERNTRPWTQPMIDSLLSAPDSLDSPELLRGEQLSDALDLAFTDKEIENPEIEIYQTKLGHDCRLPGRLRLARGSTTGSVTSGSLSVSSWCPSTCSSSRRVPPSRSTGTSMSCSRRLDSNRAGGDPTEINGYLISFRVGSRRLH